MRWLATTMQSSITLYQVLCTFSSTGSGHVTTYFIFYGVAKNGRRLLMVEERDIVLYNLANIPKNTYHHFLRPTFWFVDGRRANTLGR
jgi:hypothetical protein